MRAADDSPHKTGLAHPPVAVELQENGMGQAIDMRIQAANTVAQPLRQHRNHPIGQINTIAAALRFAIEGAAGPDICAHVRDVNAKVPAAFDFLDVDGVIEIAGVIGIDRHDVQITVEKVPNAIHVPMQAVFEKDGKPTVYVRTGGAFEPRTIKPLKRSESTMVVAEGVKPGDVVALADPTEKPGSKKDKKTDKGSAMGALPGGTK